MRKTTTDGKWKKLKYRYEVPAKVLADQFDYQTADDCTDGFILYRRHWYHLDQFMRADVRPDDVNGQTRWHGFHSDSFFSGVAIELSDDGEEYRIGTVTS